MKQRAMGLEKIAFAGETLELPPGAAIGMAIGAQIVQPQPAAIVTRGVGTKVHRGVHGPGAAGRERHGSGPWRGRWSRLVELLLTQHTVRLVRQARERCGLGGTLALGLSCRG